MIEVNEEEIESWMAMLFIKGQTVDSYWDDRWQRPLDLPLLAIEKETTWEKNVQKITHYLKVKFNLKGRARRLYKEWPKAFVFAPWMEYHYVRNGLAEVDGDKVTIIDGRGNGKAIYKLSETTGRYRTRLATLVAYEGTVR